MILCSLILLFVVLGPTNIHVLKFILPCVIRVNSQDSKKSISRFFKKFYEHSDEMGLKTIDSLSNFDEL